MEEFHHGSYIYIHNIDVFICEHVYQVTQVYFVHVDHDKSCEIVR